MIGQTLKPLYFTPSTNVHGPDTEGSTHHLPTTTPALLDDEWVLIDGTPASCVQIGLYHYFQHKGPIDLVVSGPNYGRNTTSVFALSSGTLGAALEAAVCRRKSIALSFAFFTRQHDPVIIEAACRHSVRVLEALYKQWPTDGSADLYSVNVPLVEGVEDHKTLWSDMLQNYWKEGSCFEEVDGGAADVDEEEERIRAGEAGNTAEPSKDGRHKLFKWAPRMVDVYESVELSGPEMDGRIVRDGNTWYETSHSSLILCFLLANSLSLSASLLSRPILRSLTLTVLAKNLRCKSKNNLLRSLRMLLVLWPSFFAGRTLQSVNSSVYIGESEAHAQEARFQSSHLTLPPCTFWSLYLPDSIECHQRVVFLPVVP